MANSNISTCIYELYEIYTNLKIQFHSIEKSQSNDGLMCKTQGTIHTNLIYKNSFFEPLEWLYPFEMVKWIENLIDYCALKQTVMIAEKIHQFSKCQKKNDPALSAFVISITIRWISEGNAEKRLHFHLIDRRTTVW